MKLAHLDRRDYRGPVLGLRIYQLLQVKANYPPSLFEISNKKSPILAGDRPFTRRRDFRDDLLRDDFLFFPSYLRRSVGWHAELLYVDALEHPWAAFFDLHNEHRLLFSRLIFFVDMRYLGGPNVLNLAAYVVLAALIAIALYRITSRNLTHSRASRMIVGGGVLAFTFAWMQAEILRGAFRVSGLPSTCSDSAHSRPSISARAPANAERLRPRRAGSHLPSEARSSRRCRW